MSKRKGRRYTVLTWPKPRPLLPAQEQRRQELLRLCAIICWIAWEVDWLLHCEEPEWVHSITGASVRVIEAAREEEGDLKVNLAFLYRAVEVVVRVDIPDNEHDLLFGPPLFR